MENMVLSRRTFLKVGGAAAAGTAILPGFLTRAAHAAQNAAVAGAYGSDTILVVVQMQGGNDGLNTVVPYGLDGYRANRPNIGIGEDKVLPLTERVGLHPEMGKLWERYKAGQVAVVQGAGYPNPNLSHFRATDIWLTAMPDAYTSRGWLGSYLNGVSTDDPLYAISVTEGLSPAFSGGSLNVPAVANVGQYQFRVDGRYPNDKSAKLDYASWVYGLPTSRPAEFYIAQQGQAMLQSTETVQRAVGSYQTPIEYPNFPLANSLKTVAQLMSADLGTRIFYAQFGGFDTHSNQPNTQARLLGGFSNSVDAFFRDLERVGRAQNVVLMTFSEFGRRVQENASQGTDHGTAGPMFVVGPRVEGGLYASYPSLTDLDGDKNLKYQVDFRSVYGTVIESWLGADQATALGARYENVGFI
jgi:uncharacterized protein (DUF1501 family)